MGVHSGCGSSGFKGDDDVVGDRAALADLRGALLVDGERGSVHGGDRVVARGAQATLGVGRGVVEAVAEGLQLIAIRDRRRAGVARRGVDRSL